MIRDRAFDLIIKRFPEILEHWRLASALVVVVGLFSSGAGYWLSHYEIANLQSTVDNLQSVVANKESEIGLVKQQLTNVQENQSAAEATPHSEWRNLSDKQRAMLEQALREPANHLNSLVLWAMASQEPRQYAEQFRQVFEAAGVSVLSREVPLSASADVGLMVGVTDVNHPSAAAQRFKLLLEGVGLHPHFTYWQKQPGDTAKEDFDLFVGPHPW